MRFSAILFDGYGTLFEDAIIPLKEICDRIVRRHELEMEPEKLLEAWDRHFFPLIQGDFLTLRRADVLSLQRLFVELAIEDLAGEYVDDLFERFNSAPVYPDVMETLGGLGGGWDTGIVSNADVENIEGVLRVNGLRFPVVVTSESARVYKPDPRIFRNALDLLRRDPESVLYVGDSQEDDLKGGKRAGIKVVWLNRRGEPLRDGIPSPDFEIRKLTELLSIV